MMRIRPGISALSALASLALTACASDDAGVRALAETTMLRAQMDDMRQRQDASTREVTRLQSQVRALETDAVDKTRDVKAAGVELARARVLLEETRGMLRERETAVAATPEPARPTAMTPVAAALPSAPDPSATPPPPPPMPSPPPAPVSPTVPRSSPPVTAARPPAASPSVARPVAPDPRAIPESKATPPPAPEAKPVAVPPPAAKPAPEAKPVAVPPPAAKPAPEAKPAAVPTPAAKPAPEDKRASRPAPLAEPSAEKLFAAAMANFRAQEHGQAVLELTDLITHYPSHSLAPAAQLWIGEAYYQQRDYHQALIELKRVSEAYPRSPQVADALLKSGLCQRALGDRVAATAAWEQVVHDYPASAAAGQAKTLLGSRESAARVTR
jgi:tol-pal system protein YbgF